MKLIVILVMCLAFATPAFALDYDCSPSASR
jgi:hypothetical protein